MAACLLVLFALCQPINNRNEEGDTGRGWGREGGGGVGGCRDKVAMVIR